MTLEELGWKLQDLEETRKLAQAELASLGGARERVEELKKDREALIDSWAGILHKALEDLMGEQRNKIYRMLRLEVAPVDDGYTVTLGVSSLLQI
jgi:hypothetical protein